MKRSMRIGILMVLIGVLAVGLAACGKDNTDYENLRDLSWEGKELTITLGENKGTGCVWTTHPEDDSIIDYSTHRVFHLADSQVKKGNAIGSLEAGFQGKGAGTTRILCTTPVGWDGSGDGFSYIVTVTVGEDGTIEKAEGKNAEAAAEPEDGQEDKKTGTEGDESDPPPADGTAGDQATLEDYFAENPDELEEMKKSINENESYKDQVTIDLDVKGNTLSYIYTFKETYSDEQVEQMGPEFSKSMEGEFKEDMKEKIEIIEKGYGVDGVKMYIEYRNGDGKKIYGGTIE